MLPPLMSRTLPLLTLTKAPLRYSQSLFASGQTNVSEIGKPWYQIKIAVISLLVRGFGSLLVPDNDVSVVVDGATFDVNDTAVELYGKGPY